MTIYYTYVDSPIGSLLLASNGTSLTELSMTGSKNISTVQADWQRDDNGFTQTRQQLRAYFDGRLKVFDLPLEAAGTDFQRRVWQALRDIPFGETESYGQLAERIGNPRASRAVGLANGRNPISIIVPCHRVIGANGSLTGYGGGIERKRWLLAHEADHLKPGLSQRRYSP